MFVRDCPRNGKWPGLAGRPNYDPPEPSYARGKDHNLQKYVDFMSAQIAELLSNYGPVAGIWLDGIAVPKQRPDGGKVFKVRQLYDQVHKAQPQVLVSYKQGLLGTEDFFAPERHWDGQTTRPMEICDTLQPRGWGYIKADNGKHKTPEKVMTMLAPAAYLKANLLLNTGPLPDGAVHAEDQKTLREVGRRIAKNGFPAPVKPPPRPPKRRKKKVPRNK